MTWREVKLLHTALLPCGPINAEVKTFFVHVQGEQLHWHDGPPSWTVWVWLDLITSNQRICSALWKRRHRKSSPQSTRWKSVELQSCSVASLCDASLLTAAAAASPRSFLKSFYPPYPLCLSLSLLSTDGALFQRPPPNIVGHNLMKSGRASST